MNAQRTTRTSPRHADGRGTQRNHPATRRGSIYVVVLGVGLVVSVIGFSALTLARVQNRRSKSANDWNEAVLLARAGIDAALDVLNSDDDWRENYANNVEYGQTSLGNGTYSWKLVDSDDGDLADEPHDEVRLYGIGRSGGAARTYSVLLPADEGLDVLSTTACATGNVTATGTPTASGGPLASGALFTVPLVTDLITADVDAGTLVNLGMIDGTVTVPASARQMPASTVFSDYAALATSIPYTSTSGQITACVLSKSSNPYGVANADGVYAVQVPLGSTLFISAARLEATLLVTLNASSTLKLDKEILWQPPRPDFASLIVQAPPTASVVFTMNNKALKESTYSANFNPSGTPYNGVADADLVDQYPSSLNGIFHVVGAGSPTRIEAETVLVGTLLTEGLLNVSDRPVLSVDPNLRQNNPWGYTGGAAPQPVEGSWVWDSL
jgi:hypothetical protein